MRENGEMRNKRGMTNKNDNNKHNFPLVLPRCPCLHRLREKTVKPLMDRRQTCR